MILLGDLSKKRRWAILLIVLLLANLFVWGGKHLQGFPDGALYSTGNAFSADGKLLIFADRLQFKGGHFSYGLKVNWDDKTNLMQEAGLASRGIRGELKVELRDSASFGSPILGIVELDDELSFGRSYLQSRHANMSMLPLSGEFEKNCYYMLYTQRTFCGSTTQRSP